LRSPRSLQSLRAAVPARAPLAAAALVAAVALVAVWIAPARATAPERIGFHRSYLQVINRTAAMVRDRHAQRLARAHKLRILNVMWEDTGRFKGSSLGPNISDVTIEVHARQGRRRYRKLMPVIRYPNFTDKTGDVRLSKLFIRVGNQRRGGRLETISLKQFLKHPTRYMSLPRKGRIKGGSLLARRDSHVLVSAQAAFLPIGRRGKATFYPVIFNYQSRRGHPAVLTLLVTRQGTSMTVIDNSRDSVGPRSWGQRLFFNKGGKRAPLVAERLSDVKSSGTTQNGESAASLGKDANLLMLIQIPLKYKPRPRRYKAMAPLAGGAAPVPRARPQRRSRGRSERSDVEAAVLGHGKVEGPYTELAGLTIERDPRFPIRATVQFYQATSNGVISRADMRRLSRQIATVYEQADYVGSLVVPETPKRRVTEWSGISRPPRVMTWRDFPGVVQWFHDNGWGLYRHRIRHRRFHHRSPHPRRPRPAPVGIH
jgi:hypothetical protein